MDRDRYRYRVLGVLPLEDGRAPIRVALIGSSSPAEGGMGDLLALGIEYCHVDHTRDPTHRDVVLCVCISFLEPATRNEEGCQSISCVRTLVLIGLRT